MHKKTFLFILDMVWYFLGCALYASAVSIFIIPNEISPGGLTGVATILQRITGIPSGILLMAINLPILLLGFIKFGGAFIIKTFIATFMLSVNLTVSEALLPTAHVDPILAAVFGGMMMGLGLSLVIYHGATTGGIDIIAKLINRRFPHFTVGRVILMFDGFVIFLTALVYKNLESALYSVVALYVSSRLMDTVLYGSDKGKIVYVISSNYKKISDQIAQDMHRGVTMMQAKGGYTGSEYVMLMCIVRRHEVSQLYRIIEQYDEHSFTVVSDAGEIIGEGFKQFGK